MHAASAARIVALAACLLLPAAAARAQTDEHGRWENGFTEAWWFKSDRYTAEQAEAARAQWQRIGEAQDSWAGDYLIDMSVRAHVFRWSPGGGFVFFNVNTCMSNVDNIDFGEVIADTPSHVELASKLRPDSPNNGKFVKVSWGARRYLIEEHQVGNFCDYVAGLGPYNGGVGEAETNFLAHRADGEKPTALLPTVPPEYQELVRRPIDATITRVGRSYVEVDPEKEWHNDLVTPVRISAGSDQGLRRGMSLNVLDSDEFNENVEVTRVFATSARGIIVRWVRKRPGVKLNEWDDGKDNPDQPITVGWRLTTSLHKQLLRADARSAAWEARQKRER